MIEVQQKACLPKLHRADNIREEKQIERVRKYHEYTNDYIT